MSYYIFMLMLSLSDGVPDGTQKPVRITVETTVMSQCLALRREAIKMLGGTALPEAELEKRIGRCIPTGK